MESKLAIQLEPAETTWIRPAPKGWAIALVVGPSLVWCAEYIGSGEVILATRTGAVLGTAVLWAVVFGIFLKYWIGMSGARYTVCTGEGMIDMCARMPGPRNWAVWIILVAQLAAAAISIASIAAAAGAFVHALLPVSSQVGGWVITIFAVVVVWSGTFDILKIVMSIFVLITVIGVIYVAGYVLPGAAELFAGLMPGVPPVPDWAIEQGTHENGWREVLPLLGWGAGGFASQVWYTYWVLGAGYGAASGRSYGEPAPIEKLRRLGREEALRLKGWCRVVYADATLAMVIGIVVTSCFLIAGAGILRPLSLAPDRPQVAITLSTIFSSRWAEIGGTLFLLGGLSALVATQIGQLAGWPRLLADAVRICISVFNRRLEWKQQFRSFLLLFFASNMILVYTLGLRPVALVKLGAVLDGLLLTPLQALWVLLGLFVVLPKVLSREAYEELRPHWIIALGLVVAFLVFGYFCVFQMPYVL